MGQDSIKKTYKNVVLRHKDNGYEVCADEECKGENTYDGNSYRQASEVFDDKSHHLAMERFMEWGGKKSGEPDNTHDAIKRTTETIKVPIKKE